MSRLQPQWLMISVGFGAALHAGKLPAALPVLREALGVSPLQAGFLLSLVLLWAKMRHWTCLNQFAGPPVWRRPRIARRLAVSGTSLEAARCWEWRWP